MNARIAITQRKAFGSCANTTTHCAMLTARSDKTDLRHSKVLPARHLLFGHKASSFLINCGVMTLCKPLRLLFLWGPSAYASGSTSAFWLLYYPRIGLYNFLYQFRNVTPPEQRKLEL
jgi:hypothetical protein